MTRISLVLLALLTLCALSLVNSQHEARKLFVELGEEQEQARQLEVEYGQLQLEASTWAMHARVEKIAQTSLRMRRPEAGRVQIIDLAVSQAAQPGAAGARGLMESGAGK